MFTVSYGEPTTSSFISHSSSSSFPSFITFIKNSIKIPENTTNISLSLLNLFISSFSRNHFLSLSFHLQIFPLHFPSFSRTTNPNSSAFSFSLATHGDVNGRFALLRNPLHHSLCFFRFVNSQEFPVFTMLLRLFLLQISLFNCLIVPFSARNWKKQKLGFVYPLFNCLSKIGVSMNLFIRSLNIESKLLLNLFMIGVLWIFFIMLKLWRW